MEALFLKLVNMSISASWLVLAVVVLRFVMNKAPKWMTCALWALVAIRLVFPFSIESAFSLIPEPEPIPQTVITNYTPIVMPGDIPVSSDAPVISPDAPMLGTQANTVTPAGITELAATVWIVGVAVLLLYALVSYLLIHRKVSASICLRENIYLCDYIESPFILGIFRPGIYLPSSLDEAQWPHVIAHEQAHLHRKDHWWKPLGFAILCVYWFNPVLWLAYALLCKDIELACDERVIRDMDTRQKQDYTTALLECSMPRYLIAACPLAFGEVGVKERVKSVLNYKKPAFWIILIALLLCIAAAVCFLTDPVKKESVTPGNYKTVEAVFLQVHPNRQEHYTFAARYILQDNTLYTRDSREPIVFGHMTPYDLTMEELKGYFQPDQWNRQHFHYFASVSDALWLPMADGTFYVWFVTSRGETYLACGFEDTAERHTESDDTYITHIARLAPDKNAEELELAWFDATVVKSTTTWITVEPNPGSAERNSSDRIEVSLYWHHSDDRGYATGILGEFQVGDRVRIVYDGQIQETYPARISNTHSVTMLAEQDVPPADDITPSPSGLQFDATVLEVNDGSILVEPLPGTVNHPGMDRLWVSRKLTGSEITVPNIKVGDLVSIRYDGMIAETYPGQINTVYDIQVLPADTEPPGTYYHFKTAKCLFMNPLSSQGGFDDNGRNYIFDSGMFRIEHRPTGEVLFECSTEDIQWLEFPFDEARWSALLPDSYDDRSELRNKLWGAQYLPLSDNYCLFLKDGTLYVAYGFFTSDIDMEYFWDIYELCLG